ncbi:MAG: spermine synthase [Verrucomicrobiales bacterium]|nr:spermine synthase [Verrucomicrobiales bacterium]
MKPFATLAETETPDGKRLSLHERDGVFFIYLNGQQLMSSRATSSETRLAELACAKIDRGAADRVLIGGLGLGFTLRRALQLVGDQAKVEINELISAILDWNREHLKSVNGDLLDDPRVKIRLRDVAVTIQNSEPEFYAAMMLDVDNGPVAMVSKSNRQLYTVDGLLKIARALTTGGRAVFWSASKDDFFLKRLKKVGFKTNVVPSRAYPEAKKETHVLYQAEKTSRTGIK